MKSNEDVLAEWEANNDAERRQVDNGDRCCRCHRLIANLGPVGHRQLCGNCNASTELTDDERRHLKAIELTANPNVETLELLQARGFTQSHAVIGHIQILTKAGSEALALGTSTHPERR